MALMTKDIKWSRFDGFREFSVDYDNCNSDIDCSEVLFKEKDGDIIVFLAVKNGKPFWKPDEIKENEKFYFVINSKEYTKWTKEDPKKKIIPQPLELFLLDAILDKKAVELDIVYSGTLLLNSSESTIEAVKQTGRYDIMLKCSPLEGDIQFLKDIPEGKKGGFGGGYAKGQSELEKLNDRTKWMMTQCGQPPETLLKDFDPTTVPAMAALLTYIFQ